MMRRWLRFNAVGAAGYLVQAGALWLLTNGGLHYVPASLAAVEAAILHNFVWHWMWTWRMSGSPWPALGRFHVSNGFLSLTANLILMPVLAGLLGLPAIAANAIVTAICCLLNWLAALRFVFR
jgi:putative flippase GtrA